MYTKPFEPRNSSEKVNYDVNQTLGVASWTLGATLPLCQSSTASPPRPDTSGTVLGQVGRVMRWPRDGSAASEDGPFVAVRFLF